MENKTKRRKIMEDYVCFFFLKQVCSPEQIQNKCVIFSAFQLANLLWFHVVISMFLSAEMPAKTIVVLVTVFKPRLWIRRSPSLTGLGEQLSSFPFQHFQERN